MIFTPFVNLCFIVLNFIINVLPDGGGFPTEVHDAVVGLGGFIGIWSPIIPISTLATCVGLAFSVEIAIFGFKTVKWLVSHIPWIGGKGN